MAGVAAPPGSATAASRVLALDFVVRQLWAAASRLDLALQVADAAAGLTGEGPCLVALDADERGEAILASSSGRALPFELLGELGLHRVRATSRRWIAAHRFGYGPDDPLVRLAERLPISLPGVPARPVGTLLVFEHKGGEPLDPTGLASTRILASLTGSVLAGSTPTTRCDCSAEAERLRILAELHDGLLQKLYGLGLEIEAAATRPGYPTAVRSTALRWQQVLAGAIDETRSVLERLDRSEASTPALGAGLDMLATEAAALNGVDVDTQILMESEVSVPAEIRRSVLIVAQEALRNSVRHSGAGQVQVRLKVDAEGLQLVVEDDGVGFVPTEVGRGHGLRSMAARASAIGGSLGVTSSPGNGARVVLWAPVAKREHGEDQRPVAGCRSVMT